MKKKPIHASESVGFATQGQQVKTRTDIPGYTPKGMRGRVRKVFKQRHGAVVARVVFRNKVELLFGQEAFETLLV